MLLENLRQQGSSFHKRRKDRGVETKFVRGQNPAELG